MVRNRERHRADTIRRVALVALSLEFGTVLSAFWITGAIL